MRGAASVIHLTAGSYTNWKDYEAAFVGGTRNVIEACLRERPKRLLFASSIAVYYLGSRSQRITSSTPIDSHPQRRSHYARSKIHCERLLVDAYRENGLPVTILRPGVVVGEGGLVQHSGVGHWPRPIHCLAWGSGTVPLPFVLVEDVVSAFVSALQGEALEGRAFNLVGDVRLTAADYVRHLARLSARQICLHPQAISRLHAIEIFKWFVKLAAGKPENAWPMYRDLKTRTLAASFDCQETKEALRWSPVVDEAEFVDAGIRRALSPR